MAAESPFGTGHKKGKMETEQRLRVTAEMGRKEAAPLLVLAGEALGKC